MSDTVERLVYMANQIARNFEALGEAEAVSSTASHIEMFWDPRMKRLILEHQDAGGAGLSPITSAALGQLGTPANAR